MAPPDEGVAAPATQVIHHAGLVGWQIRLMAGAAVVVIGLTGTPVTRRGRTDSHRPAIS